MAENKCERGQPTKRKVGCKILANMTAKQRQVWLQIKGERGQRRVEKKREKKQRKNKVKANKTKEKRVKRQKMKAKEANQKKGKKRWI